MGAKGIEFDGKSFEYLGAPAVDHLVCGIAKASGVTSMERWFAALEGIVHGLYKIEPAFASRMKQILVP
ncbi:MAG TPA: hypothetical protein VF208_09270, partial [Candidatus Binatia bacterium]